MSSTPFIFKLLNPIMKSVLRSPLHTAVSNQIMIISFKGKKSGQEYETPISYFQENGKIYCFTHGRWWRNLADGAPVRVRVQGEDLKGFAEAIPGEPELQAEYLTKMLRAIPTDARFYDVKIDAEGEPDPEDVNKAVLDTVMVRIRLSDLQSIQVA